MPRPNTPPFHGIIGVIAFDITDHHDTAYNPNGINGQIDQPKNCAYFSHLFCVFARGLSKLLFYRSFVAMKPPQRILFSVTNDLSYDQRMHRICGTLADAGYEVYLIGRHLPNSLPLSERSFRQVRLRCWTHKGFAFYGEFNIRLLFFLVKTRFDAVCSIDLDTLPAGWLGSLLKNKKRVFDAHEYFTEVPEVVHRPLVKWFWTCVAYFILPFYKHAYTVGPALAHVFSKKYHIPFAIIRNVPYTIPLVEFREKHPKILLYQGALNEGRGIEVLLEAMTLLPDGFALWLAGEGDLSADLRARAMSLKLDQKVRFWGFIKPEALKDITDQAWLGLNLLENKGESYYYSLANKFFDYVQARIPMLTMNFPEYAALNQQYEVAVLMDDLNPKIIAEKIQELANTPDLYRSLQSNCDSAAQEWNWENERVVLLEFWKNV